MGIPASDAWVCPGCRQASDPELWLIREFVVHWEESPATLCGLWCPECGEGFAGEAGRREIARLTRASNGEAAAGAA